MPFPRTDDLDYDQEIYDRFSPRSKSSLARFFNIFRESIDHRAIDESTYDKEDLLRIIGSEFEEHAREFLDYYEQIKDEGVLTDPAVDYLSEHHDINEQNLDIGSRFELLLVIFEEGLTDALDEILVKTKIQAYSATRAFYLPEELELEGLSERISDFHESWNLGQDDPDVVYVDEEFTGHNLRVLKVYQEVGKKFPPTFSFRLEGGEASEVPAVPEVTTAKYHQLKTIRFQIEQTAGETELIFTDSFSRWRVTLETFFEDVFGIDDVLESMSVRESEVAKEIEQDIAESVDAREDPVSSAQETIGRKQENAKTRVDRLGLPAERKQSLKESIETIKLSGSEILDDQSIQTQEFRLVAGLEGLFSSVDGIESGFREILKQANTDSRAFVITINNRPVQFSKGEWKHLGTGGLPELDKRALQIFFGDS